MASPLLNPFRPNEPAMMTPQSMPTTLVASEIERREISSSLSEKNRELRTLKATMPNSAPVRALAGALFTHATTTIDAYVGDGDGIVAAASTAFGLGGLALASHAAGMPGVTNFCLDGAMATALVGSNQVLRSGIKKHRLDKLASANKAPAPAAA